jgi:hypothetical protein
MSGLVRFHTAFEGELIAWRGPSPYHFVPLPPAQAAEIRFLASAVTYGWGVIPVRCRIGRSEFTTSLFPRDGGYLLPIKDKVRKDEGIAVGDGVRVELTVGR